MSLIFFMFKIPFCSNKFCSWQCLSVIFHTHGSEYATRCYKVVSYFTRVPNVRRSRLIQAKVPNKVPQAEPTQNSMNSISPLETSHRPYWSALFQAMVPLYC